MSYNAAHKAFSLNIEHEYHPLDLNKINERLDIQPTSSCDELLRGARMLFRPTQQGGVAFYQSYFAAPGTPLVNLSNGTTFNFSIGLKEKSEFLNFTDLNTIAATYQPGKVYLLSYTVTSAVINPSLAVELLDSFTRKRFTQNFTGLSSAQSYDVSVTDGTNPVNALRNLSNVAVSTLSLTSDGNGLLSVPVDLGDFADGKYVITLKQGATVKGTFTCWADDALAGKLFLGVISIKYASVTELTNSAIKFSHRFKARETYWRYYILPKKIPANFYSTHKFELGLPGGFPAVTAENNGTATAQTSVVFDGISPVIFKTNTKIKFSDQKTTGISLIQRKVSSGSTKTLISQLPNPIVLGTSTDRYNALQGNVSAVDVSELFVYVDEAFLLTP